MRLILIFLLSLNARAEYFEYSHQFNSENSYRVQTKVKLKNSVFADLEFQNSFDGGNKLDIRRAGGSYGIELKPVKIFIGAIHAMENPATNPNRWNEFFIESNYRVKHFPLLIDLKYSIQTGNKEQENANVFNFGVGYEVLNDVFLRIEKGQGNNFYIGVKKINF